MESYFDDAVRYNTDNQELVYASLLPGNLLIQDICYIWMLEHIGIALTQKEKALLDSSLRMELTSSLGQVVATVKSYFTQPKDVLNMAYKSNVVYKNMMYDANDALTLTCTHDSMSSHMANYIAYITVCHIFNFREAVGMADDEYTIPTESKDTAAAVIRKMISSKHGRRRELFRTFQRNYGIVGRMHPNYNNFNFMLWDRSQFSFIDSHISSGTAIVNSTIDRIESDYRQSVCMLILDAVSASLHKYLTKVFPRGMLPPQITEVSTNLGFLISNTVVISAIAYHVYADGLEANILEKIWSWILLRSPIVPDKDFKLLSYAKWSTPSHSWRRFSFSLPSTDGYVHFGNCSR